MREDYVVDGKNEDSECYSLLKWEWERIKKEI
jgi:ribosomal-protein-alanine N-acetyltransferase